MLPVRRISMPKWMLPVFSAFLAMELLIPAGLIVRQEVTLKKGKSYEFVTAPVDPVDLFRGRYLQLGFFEDRVDMDQEKYQSLRKRPYALLERDANGRARIAGLFNAKPSIGDWVRVKKLDSEPAEQAGRVHVRVEFPFGRFYMNENRAPKAEEYFRSFTLPDFSVLKVKVLAGNAAVEDLYIGDRPSREWIRTMGQ